MKDKELNDDTVNLSDILKILLKKKWVIIGGTFLFTLIAVVISFLLPKQYKSTAFFKLSSGQIGFLDEAHEPTKSKEGSEEGSIINIFLFQRVSVPDYKKYSPLFLDLNHYKKYIKFYIKNRGKSKIALNEQIGKKKNLADLIKPKYAHSREDVKQTGVTYRGKENYIVGLNMKGTAYSPAVAQQLVDCLGSLVRDSILYGKLGDYIHVNFNKAQLCLKKIDNEIIENEFKLVQLSNKLKEINKLLQKYPQLKNVVNRELVSLERDGQRYLSPVMQAVGIESHLADIKECISGLERVKKVMDLRLRFFSKAKDILHKEIFSEILFGKISKLKNAIFEKLDLSNGIFREVFNDLSSDFENFLSLREEMVFVAGPTLPVSPFKPSRKLIVATIFILSFCLFIFLAFLLNWWEKHKRDVLNKK